MRRGTKPASRITAELKRVTEERDILKKAAAYFAKESRRGRIHQSKRTPLPRTTDVPYMAAHPSGYYAWQAEPVSAKQKDDQRLPGLIKPFWLESGGAYGYRKITDNFMI